MLHNSKGVTHKEEIKRWNCEDQCSDQCHLTNCRCERSVLGDLTLCVNACLTPLNGLMKGMTLCHSVIITLCHFFHQSFTSVRSLSTDLSMTQQGIEYDVNLEDSFYNRLLSWRHLYLYIQVGLSCCALLCNWLSTGVSGAIPDFTGAFSTAEWPPSQINQNNCIQTVKPLNSYCKITLLYLSIKSPCHRMRFSSIFK